MGKPLICPRCGAENAEAGPVEERRYCLQCGRRLESVPREPSGEAILGRVLREMRGLLGKPQRSRRRSAAAPPRQPQTRVLVTPSAAAEEPIPATATQVMSAPASASSRPTSADTLRVSAPVTVPVRPVTAPPAALKPFTPGTVFAQRYQILTARALSYSVYYDAMDLFCPQPTCGARHSQAPPGGVCVRCGQPLDTVLIRERRPLMENAPPPDKALLALSQAGHPDILPHRDMLAFQQAVYTVVEHPGRWGVLVRGRQARSPDAALMLLAPIGRALLYLHQQGTAFIPATVPLLDSLERLITFGGDGAVKVADLSACLPFLGQDGGRAQVARDISFLGQTLLYLMTGTPPAADSLDAVPAEQREVIDKALHGQYPTVAAMLAELAMAPPPIAGRPLKPRHGQATDPGRKHARNEDSVVTFTFDKAQQGGAVPIGFYMVADGMGGHDAGDVASRMVYQVVTEWILKSKVLPDLRKETRKFTTENIPGNLLKEAIQAANKVLARHATAQQSNMGSTVTAALIIGNVATIANVGDSRTYLLREGQLRQITQDHSLVARLVQAHVITPEQVRSHPQRNQIYRSLGQQEHIEVDTYTVLLSRGDRLILCCDGLWEMVLDADIQRIVETARSPQQACDALIAAANAAGGEDNISVIVVEME